MSVDEIRETARREIPVELCVSSNVATTQCGVPALLPHLKELYSLKHNLVICCDDTMLFGTNISNEMFEFAKAVNATTADLKQLLLRNAEGALFAMDEETRLWVRQQIERFPVRGAPTCK
jgi:adenosine deaminase